jgi:hypothetical protein
MSTYSCDCGRWGMDKRSWENEVLSSDVVRFRKDIGIFDKKDPGLWEGNRSITRMHCPDCNTSFLSREVPEK